MTDLTISNLALILLLVPVLVHGIEVLWPMQSRFIVNFVLPFFGFKLPNSATALTYADQQTMLDAARDAAPEGKKTAAEDYIFLMLFEERQGAIGFIAAAVGAIYGLSLGLADRDAIHLIFGVISVLMMLANANQIGLPFFGNHPKVSPNGRNVGYVFVPFWAVATLLNGLGFTYALA